MKSLLPAIMVAGALTLGALPCSAQTLQPATQCTVTATGPNGRNKQAEEVANSLLANRCAAGSAIRLTDIQPTHDERGGDPTGAGSYYFRILCQGNSAPMSIDGPYEGVQTLTCRYNGEDAKPGK